MRDKSHHGGPKVRLRPLTFPEVKLEGRSLLRSVPFIRQRGGCLMGCTYSSKQSCGMLICSYYRTNPSPAKIYLEAGVKKKKKKSVLPGPAAETELRGGSRGPRGGEGRGGRAPGPPARVGAEDPPAPHIHSNGGGRREAPRQLPARRSPARRRDRTEPR